MYATEENEPLSGGENQDSPGNGKEENNPSVRQPWDQVHDLFEQAPTAVIILKGAEFIVELANAKALEIIGRTREEALGNKFGVLLPELEMQNYHGLLQMVFQSGQRYVAEEAAVTFKRNDKRIDTYVKFVFQPLHDEANNVVGVMISGDDIGEKVYARKMIEDSEERFRAMAHEAPLFVWETDANLQTTFLNKVGRDYFALGENFNTADLSWKPFMHPDDLPVVLSVMENAAQKKQPYTLEMRLKNGNTGEYRWFLDKGVPRYSNDKLTGFIGTSLDIHDRKTAESLLEEKVKERTMELEVNQSFLRQLIDSSVEFVAVLDTKLHFIMVNKKFEDFMGMQRDQIIGKYLFDINPKAENTEQHQSVLRALQGETVHLDKRKTVARTDYDVDTYYVPLILQENIEGVIIMARDISDIVQTEKLLGQKNAELEQINKDLESFTYIASHDLQEPLRKIHIFAKMLQDKERDPTKQEKYIGNIVDSAKRMSLLIQSVLDYSRLSQKPGNFESVDLNNVWQNVLTDHELIVIEKNAVIESDKLPVVYAVSLQMQQLFSNLLSNALKFSNKEPHITITSKIVSDDEIPFRSPPPGEYAQIQFSDNGIGFAPEYSEQIFKLFQRLHEYSEYSGTGVGLSIVQKIIEQHHGFIHAESVQNEGATFTFWLPV